MRLVFQENRFIALCNFAERMAPKAAGFFWDAEKKRWWTTDLAAAVKLRDYAEGPAKSKIGKAFITVSPWLSPLPQPPPGLALKPHQVAAATWCLGRNRAYLALRPGLGKTIVAATVARALKASVVYVCPPFLVKNVQAEFRRWAPEVSVSILPDSLLGRDHAVKLDPHGPGHQLLVVDECFIEGTLVDTPKGLKKIESILPGDLVKNCTGYSPVSHVQVSVKREALRIQQSGGESFICSPDHLVFTDCGWIEAQALRIGDRLIETEESMRILRGATPEKSFLRLQLRSEMAVEPAGLPYEAARFAEGCREFRSHDGRTAALAFGENAAEKPDALRSDQKESLKYFKSDRACSTSSGWKWYGHGTGRKSSVRMPWREMGIQFCCSYAQERWLPQLLQNRFSVAAKKAWCRVRRVLPWSFIAADSGPEKRKVSQIDWLDDFALQKLGYSCEYGGSRFYDLTVEGHPSYSVNGVLVHNCHRFKSPDAKRTQALFGAKTQPGITHWASVQLYMSGSPMPNRPMELYTILSHAAPETIDFMSMFDYGRKYCGGHRTDFGWDFTGASNLPELKRRVKHPTGPFMLSMGKDVLDLPPKLEEAFVISDDMSARLAKLDRGLGEKYADVEDLIKARIAEKRDHSPEELHTATYRRILGQEKVPAVAKYVESILDSGQAVLLFAYHKDVIAELKKRLADYRPYVITGEVPTGERHELVEDFQKSKTRNLFIGNYQAMGVGFTLTKATRVLFAEYSWVPGENDQASDRAHRIGQGESVLVQFCIFEKSLDQAVMETLLRKRRITDYI